MPTCARPTHTLDEEFTGALSTLAHETRVEILCELADADDPLCFTELKSRVGLSDPGRFNYHLTQLKQHFVCRTEDGYALNYRGERVVVAAAAGVTIDGGLDRDPDRSSEVCPVCGDAECDKLLHVQLASG